MQNKVNKPSAQKGNKKLIYIFTVIILAAVILVMVIPTNNQAPEPPREETKKPPVQKEGEVYFADTAGVSKIKIDVEIADTDYDRSLGLMYREGMSELQGMLFVFPYEDRLSFWMKNTIMPLDMIFINSKREIVTIHKNTTPYSEQSYPASAPAQYVVEVVAGFCDRHNITTGDKVFWR